jgi:hypothetical protein
VLRRALNAIYFQCLTIAERKEGRGRGLLMGRQIKRKGLREKGVKEMKV